MRPTVPKFLMTTAALALAAASSAASAQVVITTTPAPVVSIPGLTGFATTGAEMIGLSVAATFSSGFSQTLAWAANGVGSGGVTGTGWSLSLSGDSFSSPWIFSFAAGASLQLTRLTLNGISGLTVFDRTEPSFGTDGSAQGVDFAISSGCAGCTGTANYSGQTAIGAALPVGDLWQVLDVVFTNGTGPRTSFNFVQDTDNDSRLMVPEPETYALLLGGFGLMAAWASRRRRGA